ncbi:MAG: hypothetical protein WCK67_08400 [bacterium]
MNFKEFKNIVQADIKADESNLRVFLFTELSKLPIPRVQVNKNTFIERAVPINKSQGDFDLSRLSYIPEHIKQIAPKGRFNNIGEPHFYGTFTDLVEPEATRFYLAAEIDQSILKQQSKTFNYTISKWRSFTSFPSILFIFKKDFCNNDLIKDAYDSYLNSTEYATLTDEQRELLVLITIELGKLKSANGYTITNIVFDFYKSIGYQSIIYPGIPGKYRGNNIAMTPNIFDRSFNFFMGAEFCLTQKNDDIEITVIFKIEVSPDNKLKYSTFDDNEIGESVSINK